jgi:gephyrin
VLHQLNKFSTQRCPPVPSPTAEPNAHTRALRVISSARALGIATFIKADDIVDGNMKLNVGFVAQLFNKCHGLVLVDPTKASAADADSNFSTDVNQAPSQTKYPMIAVADAIALVLANTHPLDIQPDTDLISACGRVSATTVYSNQCFPTFPASIMDGYACVGPLQKSADNQPLVLELVNAVRAGDSDSEQDPASAPVQSGQCVYITTGAKLPAGTDTVVKIEDTRLVRPATDTQTGLVEFNLTQVHTVGTSVRSVGSDIAEGECLLTPGRVISPVDVGLLATIGCAAVPTFRKPVVGVLSTGNELIEHTQTPSGSQIRDSNRVAMIAAFRADGYECLDLGIMGDTDVEDVSVRLLSLASKCDVVVTSGGVSMGDKDLVKPALERIGAVHFGKLNMKPGKPTMFATVYTNSGGAAASATDADTGKKNRRTLFFGLPGNPVSCLVTKSLLIDPCLKRLQGRPSVDCLHPQLQCVFVGDKPIQLDPERPEYHRAFMTVAQVDVPNDETTVTPEQTSTSLKAAVSPVDSNESSNQDSSVSTSRKAESAATLKRQEFQVRSTGNQRSSRLLSMRGSNAVLCLPQGPGVVNTGEEVRFLQFSFISSFYILLVHPLCR